MHIIDLPHVNAVLNSASTILIMLGFVMIRSRRICCHAACMIAATVTSAAFLVCYLIYHFNVAPRSIGLPPSPGKTLYLILLLSHTVLAVVALPMVVITLVFAGKRRWDKHRRIAPWTFWIWLYVSVTGVIIYYVLYHLWPPVSAV
jgi:uncharacterized membrane protein YozB (DUF420 family)